MRRVYVTTIQRTNDPDGGALGNIYVLDWDTKELLTNPRGLDPGYSFYRPRGKSHGVRGITFYKGVLYVAGSGSNLSRFDPDTYEMMDSKVFEQFRGVHQIRVFNGLLYVVSTLNDSLHKLDGYDIVETVKLETYKSYIDPFIDYEKSWGLDRLHFNSIAWLDGEEYHSYCGPHIIFNFSRKKVIHQGGLVQSPHDIVFKNGCFITNSSTDKSTVSVNLFSGEEQVIQKITPPSHSNSSEHNSCGLTRGLAISGNLLFACSSPTVVNTFRYNNNSWTSEETFDLGGNLDESIFDILLDPRDWDSSC